MAETYKITDEEYPVDIEFPPLVHGADWNWAFQLMDDDNVSPINTTGYTCQMTISKGRNGEVFATLGIGTGITMTAAQGLFTFLIDDLVVDTYNFYSAVAKVIVTDDQGAKTPFFIGPLSFVA